METLIYTIYQLKNSRFTDYGFMDYEYAVSHGFSLDDYNAVYSDSIIKEERTSIEQVLEQLFTKFNIDRPEDFRGHSMSVSDLVAINGKTYYVDSIGFVEVSSDLL